MSENVSKRNCFSSGVASPGGCALPAPRGRLLRGEGALAAREGAARDATAPVVRVGPHHDDHLVLADWEARGDGGVVQPGQGEAEIQRLTPPPEPCNAQNAAIALAAALTVGIDPVRAVTALGSFPGVARRMDLKGEASAVLVVDDFAHHPTALGVTIAGARGRWPDRRLVVAFEPRSLTAASRSVQNSSSFERAPWMEITRAPAS